MQARRKRIGWGLAALNVLAFVTLLATKSPEYELLHASDVAEASGELTYISSADPMYLAGRPFDSSAHVANVPLAEGIYFLVNVPAMLVALPVSFPMASITSKWWDGSDRASSAWQSWTLAVVFGLSSAAWAFAVGFALNHWRGRSRGAA